jgi:hypothetical protein
MHAFEILLEDRREFLLARYGEKLLARFRSDRGDLGRREVAMGSEDSAEPLIDHLASFDPSRNRAYLEWIIRQYLRGTKLEDMAKVGENLATFDTNKGRFTASERDINRFDARGLYNLVIDLRFRPQPDKEDETKARAMEAEADVLYNGSDLKVLIPKTEEAACWFGRGTQWCTAATHSTNYFSSYNAHGPLYIVMVKGRGGTKYQLHFPSMQFMDIEDNPIEFEDLLARFPKLADILDLRGIAKEQPLVIRFLENPSLAEQREYFKAVMDNHSREDDDEHPFPDSFPDYVLEGLKTPAPEIVEAAVKNDVKEFEFVADTSIIRKLSENTQRRLVVYNPDLLQMLPDASEAVQQAAFKTFKKYSVSRCHELLRHLANPSRAAIISAINACPDLLWDFDASDEELATAAVRGLAYYSGLHASINERAWSFWTRLPKKTEELMVELVRSAPGTFFKLENPPESVQIAGVIGNQDALEIIKDPSYAVTMAAIRQWPSLILHVDDPNEAMQIAAVRGDPDILRHISNPSRAVREAAYAAEHERQWERRQRYRD